MASHVVPYLVNIGRWEVAGIANQKESSPFCPHLADHAQNLLNIVALDLCVCITSCPDWLGFARVVTETLLFSDHKSDYNIGLRACYAACCATLSVQR